jgi:hypothetical protein
MASVVTLMSAHKWQWLTAQKSVVHSTGLMKQRWQRHYSWLDSAVGLGPELEAFF